MSSSVSVDGATQSFIAVIGMACRFPGAPDINAFWDNLTHGRESISFFSDDELRVSGVDEALLQNPSYVKAGAVLSDIENFDAAFFGFTPREAEILDVQQRLFLECAWQALEDASVNSDTNDQVCGTFAGVGPNTYLLQNLYANRDLVASLGAYQLLLANDKDYLATRVSYKLNLRGPAITVQTACSTSLAAIHLACQSIVTGECDMAIAGGVAVRVPHKEGYLYQPGMILSPDGHCRAFDAKAQGTVGGNGVGVVVLKPLDSAVRDGDHIRAIIRGSAINNDGALKAGYTAPSSDGQAAVISEALAVAGVDSAHISYVETHGTGTPIGDPIEIAALKKAFGRRDREQWCALGSVKTNIGHLDAAAGVAGFIKTVLCLEREQIPASLHFEQPNENLNLQSSPFYINTNLTPWSRNGEPRCAGVSSFGIGGTNVHVILQEAPARLARPSSRPLQLLVLSARTDKAVCEASVSLARHLERSPAADLADVAFTLAKGRRVFAHRRAVVCNGREEAIQALTCEASRVELSGFEEAIDKPAAFTFCGQGLQYASMTAGLYAAEPVFRHHMDECADTLRDVLSDDIRKVLYSANADAVDLSRTALAQPILFAVQYALAKLWMHWGVQPSFMVGHSIGEYVAACLSGVFSLADALSLVAERGRLMQELPAGAMLSVPLDYADLTRLLHENLALAAINAPGLCVISGPEDEIAAFQNVLSARGIEGFRLRTSHAFHSGMMDPVLEPFADRVRAVRRNAPRIPFLSNVTGRWIRDEEAVDPDYWSQQLRSTVRFLDGIRCGLGTASVLIECGPSQGLQRWVAQVKSGTVAIGSVRHAREQVSDLEHLLRAAGQAWMAGARLDWTRFYDGQRQRVPLPTYPFERQRYWIDPPSNSAQEQRAEQRRRDFADWFSVPSWKRSVRLPAARDEVRPAKWLLFSDDCGIGVDLAARLRKRGHSVVIVVGGEGFRREPGGQFVISPGNRRDYDQLFAELIRSGNTPTHIAHLWNVSGQPAADIRDHLNAALDRSFFSLLFLAQKLSVISPGNRLRLFAVSSNMQQVCGEEYLCPEKSTLLGPVSVLPRENPDVICRSIDLVLSKGRADEQTVDELVAELTTDSWSPTVAIRGGQRWVPAEEPVPLLLDAQTPHGGIEFRTGGVYLITGGAGGIGLTIAEHLARTCRANLILTSRTAVPPRETWDEWRSDTHHDDRVASLTRHIRSLEEMGSHVLFASADVTDLAAMRNVCRQAQELFGRIDGVIHAAGVPGGGVIELKTLDEARRVMAPKVQGSLVVGSLAQEFSFGFAVFCSSVTALTAEFGQVDYTAANAFIDAYIPLLRQRGVAAVGINWDTWHTVGMAADAALSGGAASLSTDRFHHAIAPAEGFEALRRVMASGLQRVIVSPCSLGSRRPELSTKSAAPSAKRDASTRHARPSLSTAYVEPSSPAEAAVAAIWEELLGITPVGTRDDFFELGGHSLLAIQILSRVWDQLHVRISLTAFFEAPSVAGLSARLGGSDLDATVQSRPTPRTDNSNRDRIPLSSSQRQLWIADRIEGGAARYNEFGIHEIRGPLDTVALERSLSEIINRHEVLRTTIEDRDGTPFQKIAPVEALQIAVTDLSALPAEHKLDEALRIAERESLRPIDLCTAPVIRFLIVRLEADVHWLYVSVHHIAFDGWSGGIFVREVVSLYEAFTSGRSSALPELPLQYADFAAWQTEWLDEQQRIAQLGFWRRQLAGAPAALALPFDRTSPVFRTFRGRRMNVGLSDELLRDLKSYGQRNGVTSFTTLLAAWAILLNRYTGQDNVIIGTPFANRKWPEIETLIGYFVNTLPIRVNLRGNLTFNDVVKALRSTVIEAQEHSDIPLDQIVADVHRGRDGSGVGLFRVLFVYRKDTTPPPATHGVTLRQVEYDSVPARSDLDLYVSESESSLEMYFVYPTELFDRSSIERMSDRLVSLIKSVMERPDARLSDLTFERPAPLPRLPALKSRGRSAENTPRLSLVQTASGALPHASREDQDA